MSSPQVEKEIAKVSMAAPVARIRSLDALRGLVMILMALDHVRDMLHHDALLYSPTDLTRASPILFLTRWVTHFCLPVFMFCAGVGAKLWLDNGRSTSALSRFLFTRGLWLMFLEITVMRLAYNFSFSLHYTWFLLILWGFGVCMVAFSALVWLPLRWLLGVSILGIALSPLLDFVQPPSSGPLLWIWTLCRQPGLVSVGHLQMVSPYPLVPWLFVMSSGFCFGALMHKTPRELSRLSALLGGSACVAFLAIRWLNQYGDPAPWAHGKNAVYTALSFLNCTKYPGSIDFILMTLGPALLLFALFCQVDWRSANPLIVFGRVPLFYFILHFYLIHLAAVLVDFVRYGSSALTFTFMPLPSIGGDPKLFQSSYGVPLWGVYLTWVLGLALLYPVCVRYGRLKARHRNSWLQYL